MSRLIFSGPAMPMSDPALASGPAEIKDSDKPSIINTHQKNIVFAADPPYAVSAAAADGCFVQASPGRGRERGRQTIARQSRGEGAIVAGSWWSLDGTSRSSRISGRFERKHLTLADRSCRYGVIAPLNNPLLLSAPHGEPAEQKSED
jgi:hypothetical protein